MCSRLGPTLIKRHQQQHHARPLPSMLRSKPHLTRLPASASASARVSTAWPGLAALALTGSTKLFFYEGVVSGKISYKHTNTRWRRGSGSGSGHQSAGHATEQIPEIPAPIPNGSSSPIPIPIPHMPQCCPFKFIILTIVIN